MDYGAGDVRSIQEPPASDEERHFENLDIEVVLPLSHFAEVCVSLRDASVNMLNEFQLWQELNEAQHQCVSDGTNPASLSE